MSYSVEEYRLLGGCKSPPQFATDKEVADLPAPEERKTYVEGTVPGLYLEVFRSGKRSWVFRYRDGTRPCKITIGPFPEITLEEARQSALDLRRIKYLRPVSSERDPEIKTRKPKCKICDELLDIESLCLEHIRDFLIHLRSSVNLSKELDIWLVEVLKQMTVHYSKGLPLNRCDALVNNKRRCTGWVSGNIRAFNFCLKCLHHYESGGIVRTLDKLGKHVFLKKEAIK